MAQPAASLVDYVQPITNALSNDVIANFLLDSSAESDLALLTTPEYTSYSFAGECKYKSPACPFSLFRVPQHIMNLFDARFVMVPVFTTAGYSALLLVKETAPKPLFPSWPLQFATGKLNSPIVLIRGVRNNATGEMIMLAPDAAENNVYCMVALTSKLNPLSPTRGMRKHRVVFGVPTEALRSKQVIRITESIRFLMRTDESPHCSKCSAKCICELPPASHVQHPLDLQTTRANIIRGIGGGRSYTASATIFVLRHGKCLRSFSSPQFQGITYGIDSPSLVSRLLKWAISNTLGLTLDAAASSNKPCPSGLVQAAYRAMSNISSLVTNTPTVSISQGDDAISAIPTLDMDVLDFPIQPALSSALVVPNLPDPQDFPPVFEMDHFAPDDSSQTPIEDKPLSSMLLDQVLDGVSSLSVSKCSAGVRETATSVPVPESNLALPQQPALPPVSSTEKNVPSKRIVHDSTSDDVVNTPGSRQAVTSATESGSSEEVDTSGLSAKEIKALRRKLRNRESAARSNKKKQLRLANLKTSITGNKKRAEELRGRLDWLRKENAGLRGRLAAYSLA